MDEQYFEEAIKCTDTPKNKIIRMGLVLLLFLAILLVLTNPALIAIPLIPVVIMYFVFPRLNREYEYIYVDGQIDFDRISGNIKRKTMLRIDIVNAEIIAPTNSDVIKDYSGKNLKIKDFTSYTGKPSYTVIIRKEDALLKIMFEPSEAMVKAMKRKQPRKVQGSSVI